jgi:hypothetical protein
MIAGESEDGFECEWIKRGRRYGHYRAEDKETMKLSCMIITTYFIFFICKAQNSLKCTMSVLCIIISLIKLST